METDPGFNSQERLESEEQARAFISQLQHALELNSRLAAGGDSWDGLTQEAEAAAQAVIDASKKLPYMLMVRLRAPSRGQISKMWEITHPYAHEFVATELTLLNSHQVDFRNSDRDEYLTIFGHVMDLEPVFED